MAKTNVPTAYDAEYLQWIQQLCQRYRQSQVKAATMVNSEMLRFYWSIGKDIELQQLNNKYGTHFFENVSRDLETNLGIKKGLAPNSIRYADRFYKLYADYFEILRQPAEKLQGQQNLQQLAEEFNRLFLIPWSHHQKIIDKTNGDVNKALFFVRKTLQNQWGRAILVNALSSDLYERQQSAQTNFDIALPAPESDLAKEYFKSPYNFEFTGLMEQYDEAKLKNALEDHITKTLVELGKGFAFVGREYRISAGNHNKYIDLLFYIIPLHRYCVVEVKTTEFDFPDFGQLLGYVAMVNDKINTPGDNPAIGLLICQEKDNILAQYALSTTSHPVSIAEYQVLRNQFPAELQDQLPSEQEIEDKLSTYKQDNKQL